MTFSPTITSRSNARVKALRASFQNNAQGKGDVIGIEGEHLIEEALHAGMHVRTLFLREGSDAVMERLRLSGKEDLETVTLSREAFASAVETSSPQGVAAIVDVRWPERGRSDEGMSLVLENLQDPGNMGTLIRTAEAYGATQIYVTEGTVNQWNPKVVRASAGSVFWMPVIRAPLQQIAAELNSCGAELYAAVAQQQRATSLLDVVFQPRCALMIGNEGAGLSDEALQIAQHRVWIPCAIESLNAAVAGATLMYEAMRQFAGCQSKGGV